MSPDRFPLRSFVIALISLNHCVVPLSALSSLLCKHEISPRLPYNLDHILDNRVIAIVAALLARFADFGMASIISVIHS